MLSDDSFASAVSSGSSSASLELLQQPIDSPLSCSSKSVDEDDDLRLDGDCCCSCRKPIRERHLLKVRGFHRPWHIRCLRCSVCQAPLDAESSCFYRGRNIYCRTDYIGYRSRAFKCSKCQRVLGPTDWVRKARDHMYHLACFACDACKRQLSTGEEFALHDDRLLCKTHFVETATGSSENDGEDGNGQKQKTKRVRTSFTEDQLRILHANFRIDSNPDGQDLERIAQQTGLSKRVTQVWFQNSRARQKKHQMTTSTASTIIHSRLAASLVTSHNGSGSMTQLNNNSNNVIGTTMTSPHSPSGASPSTAALVAAQSIVSHQHHHPASAAVAVLSAAAAATYMNINIRNTIQAALHGQGQGPTGQGHRGTTPPSFDGERASSSPSERMQPSALNDTADNIRPELTDSKSLINMNPQQTQHQQVTGPANNNPLTVSVGPPDLALIQAAISGYRVNHMPPSSTSSATFQQLQHSSPVISGSVVDQQHPAMTSLFSPSSMMMSRRLLIASGLHFHYPSTSPASSYPMLHGPNDDDDDCGYFYDDNAVGEGEPTSATAASFFRQRRGIVSNSSNEDRDCFTNIRRRQLLPADNLRSPDSCIDPGFADYYSQTEADVSD